MFDSSWHYKTLKHKNMEEMLKRLSGDNTKPLSAEELTAIIRLLVAKDAETRLVKNMLEGLEKDIIANLNGNLI